MKKESGHQRKRRKRRVLHAAVARNEQILRGHLLVQHGSNRKAPQLTGTASGAIDAMNRAFLDGYSAT